MVAKLVFCLVFAFGAGAAFMSAATIYQMRQEGLVASADEAVGYIIAMLLLGSFSLVCAFKAYRQYTKEKHD
jgi:hypothetical protein